MTFGEAIEMLKQGRKVARKGWKNKFLVYVPGSNIDVREGTPYWNAGVRGKIRINGHIDMYIAKGIMQPGWIASQADMLATDWEAV